MTEQQPNVTPPNGTPPDAARRPATVDPATSTVQPDVTEHAVETADPVRPAGQQVYPGEPGYLTVDPSQAPGTPEYAQSHPGAPIVPAETPGTPEYADARRYDPGQPWSNDVQAGRDQRPDFEGTKADDLALNADDADRAADPPEGIDRRMLDAVLDVVQMVRRYDAGHFDHVAAIGRHYGLNWERIHEALDPGAPDRLR